MNLRNLHKILGVILLLPLIAWSLTGIVFLTKPGYEQAYQRLSPKTYPIEQVFTITPQENWQEYRLIRSIIGYHLLVKKQQQWLHLDPVTLVEKDRPSQAELEKLISDAMTVDKQRYGNIINISAEKIHTDTGVEIVLNWQKMSIRQSGKDTRLIGQLYKIHYLQWFGSATLNTIFASATLLLLIFLTDWGTYSYVKTKNYGTKTAKK